jgi:hypothetical protein
MEGRFKPGDHLQVRQWLGVFPYYHHGIYVRDDRVIQFGPGIAGKAHAKVEAVKLSDFERHGPAGDGGARAGHPLERLPVRSG